MVALWQESKKTLSEKNFALAWGPGPGKGAKSAQTCTHCDVTHKEPKIQAEKIFFFDLKSKTC